MSKHLGLMVAGVVCVVAGWPLYAKLSFSESVIVKGTTIEVVEPGPDLQAIIDGITDESADKRYLIKLGPGEYIIEPDTLTGEGLRMARWISITGSGQGVTVLKGAVSSGAADATSAIVSAADNAALTDLSVENTGGSLYSIAIYNGNAGPRIERVTASASGGTGSNFGVRNSQGGGIMTQVTATASGGARSFGVDSYRSAPTWTQVTATASGGTHSNSGVHIATYSPTLTQVTATASGGTYSYGVYISNSSPKMTQVTATASEATYSHGVYSYLSSPRIEASTLKGDTNGMRFGPETGTRIINTQIIGGIDADPDPTTAQCFDTYDAGALPISC